MPLRPFSIPILLFLLLSISITSRAQVSDFASISFAKADSIAALFPGYPLTDVEKLTTLLTCNLPTDVGKFRAIFRWITLNIGYNIALLRKNEEKELQYMRDRAKLINWRKKYAELINTQPTTRMLTVCSGYSELLQRMCTLADIPSKVVIGHARTLGTGAIVAGNTDHAWNVVELNNKWYLCDATWASGSSVNEEFVREFKEFYFLTEPYFFARNHFPQDTTYLLMDPKPTLKEFASAPLALKGSFVNRVTSFAPNAGVINLKSGESFTFSFTTDPGIVITRLSISVEDHLSKSSASSGNLSPNSNGEYRVSHQFTSRGSYKLSVIINRDYAMSYIVYVK